MEIAIQTWSKLKYSKIDVTKTLICSTPNRQIDWFWHVLWDGGQGVKRQRRVRTLLAHKEES